MSDAMTQRAKENWIDGVDPRLEVMNDVPLVLSTPVPLMAESRITDKSVLFIRNIQDLAEGMTMEPLPLEGWEIEITGLMLPYRVIFKATELLEMEQVEYEMILQCSGNGRAMYPSIPGTPWNQGGVGNVKFAGVPIKAILEKYNVQIDPQVRYVTAGGQDGPLGTEKPDFEKSLPVDDVIERGIIALKLNGEPLPGIHGGPVRLVVPGFFGNMQIKWLASLRFDTAESTNFYHATEYRIPNRLLQPGEKFKFTMDNSRPTWNIRLMSYILRPEPDATLKAGPTTVSGVAYNDGKARLDQLLVSFDKGTSWTPAKFDIPESPYAWYEWSIEHTFEPGTYEIWSRAVDHLGRSQPLDGIVFWNPNGYEWTGVFKNTVTVE